MHHVVAVVIGFLCGFVVFEYILSMAITLFERKNAIIAKLRKQLKEVSRSTSVPGPTMEWTVDLEKGMLEEGSRTVSPRGILVAHDFRFRHCVDTEAVVAACWRDGSQPADLGARR